MKHYLFILILLFLLPGGMYAQGNLFNILPTDLNIDLANPKSSIYSDRYQQYKDTIKALTKLEKQSLLFAKDELEDLSYFKNNKVKVKGIESHLEQIKNSIERIDSVESFRTHMIEVQKSELFKMDRFKHSLHPEKFNSLGNLKKSNIKIEEWWANEKQSHISDSLTSLRHYPDFIKDHQNEIPWGELGIDETEYLNEIEILENGDYLNQIEEVDGMTNDSYSEVTNLTNEYFGSYQEYVDAKTKVREAEVYVNKAKKYKEDVIKILRGDFENDELTNALKNRLMQFKEVRGLSDEMASAEIIQNQYKEQLEEIKYKADLEEKYEEHVQSKDSVGIVNQIVDKTSQLLSTQSKEHSKEIQQAQKILTTYQSKYLSYKNTNGEVDLQKKNSLEGKSFTDRLLFGGSLQISRMNEYNAIDLSPNIAYRFSKKYLIGFGCTYRVKLKESDFSALRDEEIYGSRLFLQYKINKLFLHGEYENMSHGKVMGQSDEVKRVLSPGALFGLGIEYSLFKGTKGNMVILYNLLYDQVSSPYDKAIVFRFGFSFGH